MIILEGCDNSGKSTLATKLARTLDLPIVHHNAIPKNKDEYEKLVETQFKRAGQRLIYDRFTPISEFCYGGITTSNDLKTGRDLHILQAMIKLQPERVMLIFCRPPTETILNFETHKLNADETKEHEAFLKSKLPLILERYDALLDYFSGYYLYNYASKSEAMYFDFIIEHIHTNFGSKHVC